MTYKSNEAVFSVVTVCYNAAATIEAAIRSVVEQNYVYLQFIVIDGGSTDGTLDILERYRGCITTFVSEADAGIFDAMNKGVRHATGDIVYFLNADDSFIDAYVLSDVARVFEDHPERLLVYGNVQFQGAPYGLTYGPAKPFHDWSVREFLHNSFCHQAIFARRSLFSDVGDFDTRSCYSADYEWVIKVFKWKPRGFYYVDRLIANYYYLGRSRTQDAVTRREVNGYYFKYLKSFDALWFFTRHIWLRSLKRRLLRQA